MPEPLLRPLRADSLRPRPAPLASPGGGKTSLASPLQEPSTPSLQPAAFAPAEEAPMENWLLCEEADDDEPDDGPDAVDSADMPMPVSVPLFELPQTPSRPAWLPASAALLLMGAAAAYLWWLM